MNSAHVEYLRAKYKVIVSGCPVCAGQDLGCSCFQDYEFECRKVRANIPVKHIEADIKRIRSLQYSPQKDAVVSYVTDIDTNIKKGKGLYLYGDTSTAKTYLACVVLISALKSSKDVSAHFITRDELADLIMTARNTHGYAEHILNAFLSVTLLCIDNVSFYYRPGKDDMSFSDYLFGKILQARNNMLRPTILTARTSFLEFSEDSEARGIPLSCISDGSFKLVACEGIPYSPEVDEQEATPAPEVIPASSGRSTRAKSTKTQTGTKGK